MAKKNLKRGIFITFEGIEGCGKSTQSKLLYDSLKAAGYACVYTREPGGTSLGEKIREIILHSDGIKISDLSELFLFEAARSQIVKEVISPARKANKIVICDRFSDATFSYQGYGGKIPIEIIKILDHVATAGLKPDLTILLDVDTLTGLERAKRKGTDRMEKKDIAYHKRVRSGYLDLARRYHKRIKVIRTSGTIEMTRRAVALEVKHVI
ncbi:MAG: dTMP kinase [Candidatus Omnitrophica bacterium]|nr:dTMP kinase [Candidatus Omnitrophota bacterium]